MWLAVEYQQSIKGKSDPKNNYEVVVECENLYRYQKNEQRYHINLLSHCWDSKLHLLNPLLKHKLSQLLPTNSSVHGFLTASYAYVYTAPLENGSYAWMHAQTWVKLVQHIKCARRLSWNPWISDWTLCRTYKQFHLPLRLTNSYFWGYLSKWPAIIPTNNYLHDMKLLDTLTLLRAGSRRRAGQHKRNWHKTAFCAKNSFSYRAGEKPASSCWAKSNRRMHKGGESSARRHTGPTRPAYIKSWAPRRLLPASRSGLSSTAVARFRKVTSLSQCSRDRGERALLCSPVCPIPIHVLVTWVFPSKTHSHS